MNKIPILKYIWTLKYLLYKAYASKSILGSYWEGSALVILILLPFISVMLIFNLYSLLVTLIIGGIVLLYTEYLEWDLKKVEENYQRLFSAHQFNRNRVWVIRFVIIDLLLFIGAILFYLINY